MGLFNKLKFDSKRETSKDDLIRTLKEAFKAANLQYKIEDGIFSTGFMGDDLPIPMGIFIDDTVMCFRCPLALKAEEINYQKVVWELNAINSKLTYGAFSLDPESGYIAFEYGFPYGEAKVSPGFLLAFIKMVIKTVDENDGKLKAIAEQVSKSEFEAMYG